MSNTVICWLSLIEVDTGISFDTLDPFPDLTSCAKINKNLLHNYLFI